MILKYRSQLINFFLLCFQTMQRWNPVFFPVIFQLFFLPPPFMTWSNILRRQGKCRKIWKWYQNSGGMIYMTRKNIPSIKTGILYMYPGKLGSSKFPLRTLYYLTHLYVLFFSSWVHVLLLAQNISSLCPLYLKTDEKFIHHDFASSEV